MKVSVFKSRSLIENYFNVNAIFGLPGYRNPMNNRSSYELREQEALFMVGGRSSISDYCDQHPFTIVNRSGKQLTINITRGVPGAAARNQGASATEAFFANAVGIFKNKTLTFVQITPRIASTESLNMPSDDSSCIADMIRFHDETLLSAMLAPGSLDRQRQRRLDHNKKSERYVQKTAWTEAQVKTKLFQKRSFI